MSDFLSARMSAQKLRLPLVFFFSHRLLRLPHPAPQHLFSSSLCPLSVSLFYWMGLRRLRKALIHPRLNMRNEFALDINSTLATSVAMCLIILFYFIFVIYFR